MEDTAKKAKDILVVAHNHRNLQASDIDPESPILEEQRRRILGLERMLLETQSFDFRQKHPQTSIIKFSRALSLSEITTRQAWNISVDSYRTWAPLKVPPHAIAMACIILSCKFDHKDIELELQKFVIDEDHLYSALDDILDLYLHSKGIPLVAQVPLEALLMEIKSSVMRDRMNRSTNGTTAMHLDKPENVSSIGDRGTCRFVLDRERMERAENVK